MRRGRRTAACSSGRVAAASGEPASPDRPSREATPSRQPSLRWPYDDLAWSSRHCRGVLGIIISLGIFISTVAKNQMVAMFISMFALMLPTILLSGFIFPVENMPWPLQLLSYAMPPRWFIIIIKTVMLKGLGLVYVWKETLILCGFITFFIVLSIKNFKVRLQ